ncbi:NUDIX hydrolase [Halocatena marina]|uniref:isopentenyl-diphosphate Delta-isomerase n=1 Tax=Halocatena marina TaxID=2934937 RepID=A0ABD5YGT5_9EURY|nr:NUDIX domain-containing protein [Halocatena marina]
MSTDDVSASGDTNQHENAKQSVVAVDGNDTELDIVNRLDAHTGDGTRHRAFTALVFDGDGHILLAQRSADKRLWDTHWDGTVASHPLQNQTQVEATEQRLEEELGIAPEQYDDLRVTDKFEYKRYYLNDGVEYEVCAVLKCTLNDTSIDPNPEEVGGVLWAPYEHLHDNPRMYRQLRLCPWFEIALRRDFE